MKNLNKSLLAAAVLGVIALPGVSTAANIGYPAGTQFTFASDNAAQSGNTFTLPPGFSVVGVAVETARVNQVNPGDDLRVRITLTGAEFSQSYANAQALADLFTQGAQTGGGAVVSTNASFSGGRSELTFNYPANGGGNIAAVPAQFLIFPPALELVALNDSLGQANGVVQATVSIDNLTQPGSIIDVAGAIARSVWGVSLFQGAGSSQPGIEFFKRIDVGSAPNKYTRFSPTGAIGASNPAGGATNYFNAGGYWLDITRTQTPLAYVSHATSPSPYSVNVGGTYTVVVQGQDLAPWVPATGNNIWLTTSPTCATPAGQFVNFAVSATSNTATATVPATHALVNSITNTNAPTPTPVNYVCFSANSNTVLTPQPNLSGFVALAYGLPAQRRVDNPLMPFTLQPMLRNGTVITFQNVNPASNPRAQSFLRLTNHNATACPVEIDAKDDAGRHSGTIALTLAPHQSEQFNIDILESGNDPQNRITGSFGDGVGRWFVRTLFECNNVTASALNRNNDTGVVTDLTPENAVGNQWLTPPTNL